MELLDAMQVRQRKGKPLPFLGADGLIDVNRMNRLIALLIATTVAKRLPASGQTCEKHIGHRYQSSEPLRCLCWPLTARASAVPDDCPTPETIP